MLVVMGDITPNRIEFKSGKIRGGLKRIGRLAVGRTKKGIGTRLAAVGAAGLYLNRKKIGATASAIKSEAGKKVKQGFNVAGEEFGKGIPVGANQQVQKQTNQQIQKAKDWGNDRATKDIAKRKELTGQAVQTVKGVKKNAGAWAQKKSKRVEAGVRLVRRKAKPVLKNIKQTFKGIAEDDIAKRRELTSKASQMIGSATEKGKNWAKEKAARDIATRKRWLGFQSSRGRVVRFSQRRLRSRSSIIDFKRSESRVLRKARIGGRRASRGLRKGAGVAGRVLGRELKTMARNPIRSTVLALGVYKSGRTLIQGVRYRDALRKKEASVPAGKKTVDVTARTLSPSSLPTFRPGKR